MHARLRNCIPIPTPSIRCRSHECRDPVANYSGRVTGYSEVNCCYQAISLIDPGQPSAAGFE